MSQAPFPILEGKKVPQVSFRVRRGGDWASVTTDELFAGKNVVVFSLPGAFTPTCSSTHLPRFNELAPTFKAQGIDSIVCISVNDPFVMEAWGRDQEAQNVFLLADGNGAFTEKMGLLVDKSDLNFGKRSWRYSMLVRNGVIETIHRAAGAGRPIQGVRCRRRTRLHQSAGDETRPGRDPYPRWLRLLRQAKPALTKAGYDFVEVPLPHTVRSRAVGAIAGTGTVPQVFVNGRLIGGAEDLDRWLRRAA